MDHPLIKNQIYLILETFVIESVQEEDPELKLNTALLDTIKVDCALLEEAGKEFPVNALSCDAQNEYRDLVMELYYDEIELIPNSPLLSVFAHASNVQFRAETDEEEGKDQLVVTLTYKSLFSK